MNQIPLEEENQELNTSKPELDDNGNNKRRSYCETHREKDSENMEIEAQKKKTDVSTFKILARAQLTEHNKQ